MPGLRATAISVSVICGLLLPSAGSAADSFLNRTPDPRIAALGGGLLSFSPAPSAIFTNPAETANAFRSGITGTAVVTPDDDRYRFGGVTVPAGRGAVTLAGAVNSIDTSDGTAVAAVNFALPLFYRMPVREELLRAGLTLKWIQMTRQDEKGQGYAADFGAVFNVPGMNGFSGGVAVRNIGGDITSGATVEKLPAAVSAGLRYVRPALLGLDITAGFDRDTIGNENAWSGGVSVSPVYPVVLRAGWRHSVIKDMESTENGLRGGIGIDFRNISLNYAVTPDRNRAPTHYLGVDIFFGGFTDPLRAYDHYLNHYFQEARDKYDRQDYVAARQAFADILSIYPNHEPSKEYLERIARKIEEAESLKTVNIDRLLRRADAALADRNLVKARKVYSLVLASDAENRRAEEGLRRVDDAAREAGEARRRADERRSIVDLWTKAMNYYDRGEYILAKEQLQALLELDPENEHAARYIQQIHDKLKLVTELQIDGWYREGVALFDRKKYAEAMKFFNAVMIADPGNSDAAGYYEQCRQKMVH